MGNTDVILKSWSEGKQGQVTQFSEIFGEESGKRMYDTYKAGRLDLKSIGDEARKLVAGAQDTARSSTLDAIRSEYALRAEQATSTADAINAQQAAAATAGQAKAAEAADAKERIQKSIIEDKQTLARQSAGGVKGERKVRVDFGGAGTNSRPV